MTLTSIYGVSIDELAEVKNVDNKKGNIILQSNLTLIAIILQASALNTCIQPLSTEAHGLEYTFLLLFKLIPLLACSIWMTRNLKYEKNIVQYQKNIKIELQYCLIQLSVAMFAFLSNLLFLGPVLIISVALIYILLINPKYMNREFTNRN